MNKETENKEVKYRIMQEELWEKQREKRRERERERERERDYEGETLEYNRERERL